MKKNKCPAYGIPALSCFGTLLLLIHLFTAAAASAEIEDEYAVKAAFVLNFARYAKWPHKSFADASDPFILCVQGGSHLEAAFRTISGKKIGSRVLRVRFVHETRELKECDMIFIDRSLDDTQVSGVLSALGEKPVLTIGETPDFMRHGGVINFVTNKGRLRFEINTGALDRRNIILSSRLLKLAIIVGDR